MPSESTTELAVFERIEAITPADIFNPDYFGPYLIAIREHVTAKAATLDISTETNRRDLAALAYKVGRSKTFIDAQRKALVSDEKKRLAKIDAVGKSHWEYLESLQHEVRKPLTDWEDAEKARVAQHEANLKETEDCGNNAMQTWNAYTAEAIRDRMNEIKNDPWDYQEFTVRAAGVKGEALRQMADALAKREAYEAEQEELARLRAESAARDQVEREQRIAREATEKADRESAEREAKARRETEAAEARAARAEQEAKDAAIRAERDKTAAVAAEQKRAADAKAAEVAETKAREKDKAHKAEIHSSALAAIVALGLSDAHAKKVVNAIAQGKIPNVKVVY